MKRFLIYLFLFPLLVNAQVITVKQDGTGDYTVIQHAINAAGNGDTVLVWPGTYFENVDFLEKSLCLASLAMTTGNITYANQTIIDANYEGGCIKIMHALDTTEVNGLTLIHGIGSSSTYNGGAIYAYESYIKIKNCIVKNNQTLGYGAGIMLYKSDGFISNTIVKNNHSHWRGGGINLLHGELIFDSIMPSSIFLNYAAMGTDFYKLGDCPPIHLYLDTATVASPDHYYLYSDSGGGFPADDITYNINNPAIQQVSQDIYVSNDGDNSNSGLSEDEALQTISYALLKMASDSISPDTIHVAKGLYSQTTGEKFPLNLKAYTSIVGQDRDSTILNGGNVIYILHGNPKTVNYSVKNLSIEYGSGNFINSKGAFKLLYNNNGRFEDIIFRNNIGSGNAAGAIYNSNGFLIKNSYFKNNMGGPVLRIGTSFNEDYDPPFQADTVQLINCSFQENTADTTLNGEGVGGGLVVYTYLDYTDSLTCNLINSEFIENITTSNTPNQLTINALAQMWGSNVYLINSTFTHNAVNSLGGAVGINDNSKLFIYNSILYQNEPAQLWLAGDYGGTPSLTVYNSNVETGQLGIKVYTSNYNIFYDTSNINADPLWANTGYYPYMLSYGSPCINTGTLDLPEHIELPETDLADNPRVYD
ncbi:MAG: DUF1565 domain-containing protein, partial [Bacteroidales bacterium]|nr:DUF1565 domain-containing protein [Bacteroidales bacterium]